MANPFQWTIDAIYNELGKVANQADTERAQISMNNQALIDMDAAARQLPDTAARDEILNNIKASVARQVNIARAYKTFGQKFHDVATQIQQLMIQQGLDPSTMIGPPAPPGLSGLGIAPIIIGGALLAAFLVVLAAINWLHDSNSAQSRAITLQQQLLKARVANQISPAEYAQQSQAVDKQAAQNSPKDDPLGLANFAEALIPIGLIVLGIVLIPRLLPPKRAAA